MSTSRFDRMIELLEEIRRWSRFQGWRNVKEILLETLSTPEDKMAYHYSDGRSSREVAQHVPMSHATVTNLWKKWARIGIVEPMQVQRGTLHKRIFSLDEFGIEIP